MMKAVLLAGAAMIASPLLAQETPKSDTTDMSAPATEPQATPTTPEAAPPMTQPDTAPMTQPDTATPSTPTTAAPADTTAPAQTTQATPAPATPEQPATQTAEAAPAAGQAAPDQVAAVIDADFGKYDADKNGNLSKAEFGSWMVALKKASDPTTVAESTEVTTWVGQAFAQADVDKSAAVSKPELTKFLAPQAG